MLRQMTTGLAVLAAVMFLLGFGGGPPMAPMSPQPPVPVGDSGGGAGGGRAGMVSLEEAYQEGLHNEEGAGDLAGAVTNYQAVVTAYRQLAAQADKARPVAAKAMLRLAVLLEKQGRKGEAIGQYVSLTDEFRDMPEAEDARKRLQELGVQLAGGDYAEAVIREKLQKRLETDLPGVTSFSTLLQNLRNTVGVSIVTDDSCANALIPGTLGNLGFNIKDLTVEQALTLACKAKGLDWTIYSGAVYIASPQKIGELRPKPLYDEKGLEKELSLLDQKMQIAKGALERAQARWEQGAASADDLDQFRLKVIEAEDQKAQLERLLRGGQTLASIPLSGQGSGASPGTPEIGETGLLASQAYSFVTLYRTGLQNFSGPQAVDLDTVQPKHVETVDPKSFFAENPGFDLFYVAADRSAAGDATARLSEIRQRRIEAKKAAELQQRRVTGSGGPGVASAEARNDAGDDVRLLDSLIQGRARLLFADDVQVGIASSYATMETLPDRIEYSQPAVLSATETMGLQGLFVDVSALKAVQVSQGRGFVVRTAKAQYLMKIVAVEYDCVTIAFKAIPARRTSGEAVEQKKSSDTGAESRNIDKTTLYDADLEHAPGAQVLNLETGEGIPRGSDGDMRKFFSEHQGFNLFYDRQLVLTGDGIKAALLPEGTTAATVPSEISFEYKSAASPSDATQPGVYSAARNGWSFLVIEPGKKPVYIETNSGKYLLTGVSKAKDQITFTREKIK